MRYKTSFKELQNAESIADLERGSFSEVFSTIGSSTSAGISINAGASDISATLPTLQESLFNGIDPTVVLGQGPSDALM